MNEVYAELLKSEFDIDIEMELPISSEEKDEKVAKHPCINFASVDTLDGFVVCDQCGLVLATDRLEKEPPRYVRVKQYCHEDAPWLGSGEQSYAPRRRFYKPLTHFRQHLRSYLYARNVDFPPQLLRKLGNCIDITDRNSYLNIKQELKRQNMQRYYKDIFTIIYALGGVKPQISPEQVESMCNYFKRWYFAFNQLQRFGKHNTPSIHMLMSIILEEFGHTPYYYIPTLKSEKLCKRVLDIYDQVKCSFQV